MKSKLKSFFALDDEYEYSEQETLTEEELPISRSAKHQSNKQNIVNLQSVQKSSNSKMVLIEPSSYSEAQEIADHLKSRRSVVINLQKISFDQAMRIVDFLSGTVYAIGGDIQKVGSNIFLCTPDNVDVSGSITEVVSEEDYSEKRW